MLRWRLILGGLLIGALVGLCWLDYHSSTPGVWLWGLAVVVAGLGADEARRLLARGDVEGVVVAPVGWVVVTGTLLVVLANGVPLLWPDYPADCPVGRLGWPMLGLAAGLLLAVLVEIGRYAGPGGASWRIAAAVMAMVYVGGLLSFAVQLGMLGSGPAGPVAIVSLVVVVKLCDMGAYAVGRLVGRHKLAPLLSPGKTWEGAVGGLAIACLGSWVVFRLWVPWLELPGGGESPTWGWLVFGLAVGLAGMAGDLAESLLKRDAGVKDSSSWMPGFGGVLDLLDSILAAAPVAYVVWLVELVGV